MRDFIVAKGSDYEVEVFKHKNHKIFGVQFHPENYSEDYNYGKID